MLVALFGALHITAVAWTTQTIKSNGGWFAVIGSIIWLLITSVGFLVVTLTTLPGLVAIALLVVWDTGLAATLFANWRTVLEHINQAASQTRA